MITGELEIFEIPHIEHCGNGHSSPQALNSSDGIWPFKSFLDFTAK